ncbi:cation:proton antiporter [Humibacillus xanthopallidus]|uniref:cation:proton antiporter n=1 Tax=Humibacillus xanthopallidus TaxID=412689 RepID=UPI00384C9C07
MDHLALLLFELGLIFSGLALLSWLARRLGMSAIPFFLLAGLFFGRGGLVPIDEAAAFIEVGAEIGVLLLLLLLGLEFTATELVDSLKRHRRSGIVDFALNFTPGLVAGLLLQLPVVAAVALGGVTWISSSGLIARLLDDFGRLANRETPAVLSVLVLEDIAMALFLPLLLVLLSGGGPLQALGGVALAVGAVTLAIQAAKRAGHRIARVLRTDNDEQALFLLLGLTLLAAGVTQGLGASAAVGAFLVGIAVPTEAGDRARTLLGPLRDFFAAVFFVGFGLTTAPAAIWPVLPVALLLAVVTALTKVGTGWYAAARDGVLFKGRLRAGTALIARGEFSIVIAGLAAAAGSAQIKPIATAYVLVLAVAGPLLARYSDAIADRLRPPPPRVKPPAAPRHPPGVTGDVTGVTE